jgi:hypothetical protein
MSQSQSQQHPQQHTGGGVIQSSGQDKGGADQLRQAVAAQPTLPGSIAALVAGMAGMIQEALIKADPAALQGMVDSIAGDFAAWVAAPMANTSFATLTAAPFSAVPQPVQQAFTTFAQQQAEAEAKKADAPAHGGAQGAAARH